MKARFANALLKGITAIFALHGAAGLLVALLGISVCLIEKITGIDLLPSRTHQPKTFLLLVSLVGIGCFGALEVLSGWLVWTRLSRRAICLAIGI